MRCLPRRSATRNPSRKPSPSLTSNPARGDPRRSAKPRSRALAESSGLDKAHHAAAGQLFGVGPALPTASDRNPRNPCVRNGPSNHLPGSGGERRYHDRRRENPAIGRTVMTVAPRSSRSQILKMTAASSRRNRDPKIIADMHHQSRSAHLRQQVPHIELSNRVKVAHRAIRQRPIRCCLVKLLTLISPRLFYSSIVAG